MRIVVPCGYSGYYCYPGYYDSYFYLNYYGLDGYYADSA